MIKEDKNSRLINSENNNFVYVDESSYIKFEYISKTPNRQLSPHFWLYEFACPCCGAVYVEPKLVKCLELFRFGTGESPITILSGFRCKKHNAEVGGASASQHLFGNAADIQSDFTIRILNYEDFEFAAEMSGFTGIGYGKGKFHLDVRELPDGGEPVIWEYK